MMIPAEFSNRVYKTRFSGNQKIWSRFSGLTTSFEKLSEVRKLAEGSEIDVIYENGRPVVVLVFETQEDCLAFTLKYGNKYA